MAHDKTTNQAAIRIRGARVHNLQNVDVDIPRNALVAVTGVSGCGKSSLVFNTLFAEGQRRYLESLSTYSRQFLDQLERPDVDRIDGLPPTICVDQRSGSAGRRSTLATTTEIYDYLRLLFARAGEAHCPTCGRLLTAQTPERIVDQLLSLKDRTKAIILAPLVRGRKGKHRNVFEQISKAGFVRARLDGEIVDANDPPDVSSRKSHTIEAVIDRIVVKEGIRARLQESIEMALKQGEGTCLVSEQTEDGWADRLFSSKFACAECATSFPPLEPRTFSFNSPYGACAECSGLGWVPRDENGSENIQKAAEPESVLCPACAGARLGPVARAVTIQGLAIHEVTALTIGRAAEFFDSLAADIVAADAGHATEEQLATKFTLPEIVTRLHFLSRVGLDYLTLDRRTRTLSGGEYQRARLAGCLGSGLTGVCYILDEPTIGLHARDTGRLIESLWELRGQGNSLIVVEHDLDVIAQCEHVIDIGPGAGREGGQIVATGTPTEIAGASNSVTGRYLKSQPNIFAAASAEGDIERACLTISGVTTHNLKNLRVEFPLAQFVVVTGVSGSGKSSLVTQALAPAVQTALLEATETPADGIRLEGIEHLQRLVQVDQTPIGRTARSNPATYSGVWDDIRRLFAKTRSARLRGFSADRFSFNTKAGRCAECKGQGVQRIDMHFLPDAKAVCPTCRGDQFNRPTLAIRFREKNVADILRMRFDEAADFFKSLERIHRVLDVFVQVGLGYLTLGQPASTLSGGESQRVKLATELCRQSNERTLFILDEPTTGLHAADTGRLTDLLRRLVEQGDSVIVVEHQLELIAAADWVIDLGPEAGAGGGQIVSVGRPQNIAECADSHTGRALQKLCHRMA